MFRNHIFDGHIPFRRRGRQHKGSCLNLIGDNGILCFVEFFHTDNADHIGSRAADIGAHTVQKVGYIHHMRLFCRILDNRFSVRHGSRHHNIDCCSD